MENESTLGDDFAALGKALEDYDLLAAPPPTVAKCSAKFTETVNCTEPAGHSGMHCGSGTLWHPEKPDRARKCNECGLSADDINDLTGEIDRLRAALRRCQDVLALDSIEYDDVRNMERILREALVDSPFSAEGKP